MKFREVESITDFIANSFTNGKVIRELRLTDHELTHVKETYPYAKIDRLSNDVSSPKNWYQINIKPQLIGKSPVKL